MAYSELIKNFAKIREYMSQFYVYGFKQRTKYTAKSTRSYDNERRRIESWLGKYMQFHRDKNGKNTFIALDSRDIPHNPLYNAFKAKSFTENDINLHFYILDILSSGEEKTIKEIVNLISEEYLSFFDDAQELDESTIRKKLKEYEKLGLIKSRRLGKELFYSRCDSDIDLSSWKDAAAFYSEEDPLGVVGSFILDKYDKTPDYFSFKHHYILHALESEVLEDLFTAIREKRACEISVYMKRRDKIGELKILPLKIYCSTQNGRRYVLGWQYGFNCMTFHRLDNIKKIKLLSKDENYDRHSEDFERFKNHVWGVSTNNKRSLEHIEMTIFVDDGENYIIDRLQREKRCGKVESIGPHEYLFTADVYDAAELLPRIRTFTGRIIKLECSNKSVCDTFNADFDAMRKMYGGDDNAV